MSICLCVSVCLSVPPTYGCIKVFFCYYRLLIHIRAGWTILAFRSYPEMLLLLFPLNESKGVSLGPASNLLMAQRLCLWLSWSVYDFSLMSFRFSYSEVPLYT